MAVHHLQKRRRGQTRERTRALASVRSLELVVGVLLISSCRPCHPLEPAPISKDAYWPSRGWQKSSECHPERGPYECVFYQPRCEKTDPRCGPLPMGNYRGCYDPSRERTPFASAYPGPSCQFDGECMVSDGCVSNYCTHYTVYPVGEDVCEFSSSPRKTNDDLLCGCVHHRCAAFRL